MPANMPLRSGGTDERIKRASPSEHVRIDLAGFAREDHHGEHEALMRLIERADSLGYGGIWFNEFHFRRDGLPYPSTLLLGAEILGRTRRLRFGTSVLVLPLHHPLLLAEAIGQLDRQSGGRVDVGVGRGTEPATFAALGIPVGEARARFVEALDIIIRAWTSSEVSADGPSWRFPAVGVGPTPVQRPHPPIYVAGVSAETISLAARLRLPLLLSLEPNEARQLPTYLAALEREGAGLDPLRVSSLSRYVVVASRRTNALKRIDLLLEDLRARRTRRALADGLPAPQPRGREEMLSDFAIVGTPSECVAQIRALTARTGARSMRCMFSANGLISNEDALDMMELFAADALPALAREPSHPKTEKEAMR